MYMQYMPGGSHFLNNSSSLSAAESMSWLLTRRLLLGRSLSLVSMLHLHRPNGFQAARGEALPEGWLVAVG